MVDQLFFTIDNKHEEIILQVIKQLLPRIIDSLTNEIIINALLDKVGQFTMFNSEEVKLASM